MIMAKTLFGQKCVIFQRAFDCPFTVFKGVEETIARDLSPTGFPSSSRVKRSSVTPPVFMVYTLYYK